MKKLVFLFSISLMVFGCSKYSFIESKDGQSVFLDERGGKIIYVDASNRVIEQVDLKANAANQNGTDKARAMEGREWGTKDIPGTDYKITLSSRFYNNRLLYQLKIEPYNNTVTRFARTVSIQLTDENGFLLETIESAYSWNSLVNNAGEDMGLNRQGSIPITLGNYLEISGWSPLWERLK